MSGSGGVSIARSRGGESRFYNPPPMRKQQQLQQQQQQQMTATTTMQRREQRPPLISKGSTEKRTDHEDCATLLPSSSSSSSSANNSSKTNDDNSTNLDRFLEFTTPVVTAQYLPKVKKDPQISLITRFELCFLLFIFKKKLVQLYTYLGFSDWLK